MLFVLTGETVAGTIQSRILVSPDFTLASFFSLLRQVPVNSVRVHMESAAKGCRSIGRERDYTSTELPRDASRDDVLAHPNKLHASSPFVSISRIRLDLLALYFGHLTFAFSSSKALNAMGQMAMLSRTP